MFEIPKYRFLTAKKIIYLPTCHSTNDYLCLCCKNDTDVDSILAVYTDNQTHGKGQRGNAWHMQPGKQLATSVLVPFEAPMQVELPWITLLSAFFLIRNIENFNPKTPLQLKWPNDLYVENRKLAGILTETCTGKNGQHYCVVGIGMNLKPTEDDANYNAIALEKLGLDLDRRFALYMAIDAVSKGAEALFSGMWKRLLPEINGKMLYFGKIIRCTNSEGMDVRGVFEGIDTQHRYLLQTTRGKVRLPSAEWSRPRLLEPQDTI